MARHDLQLRVALARVRVQQRHHIVRRQRRTLDQRLVDAQDLIAQRQSATAIRNAGRQNAGHIDAGRLHLIAGGHHQVGSSVAGRRGMLLETAVATQHQAERIVERPFDLDEQRSEREFDALHDGDVVLDGQIGEAAAAAAVGGAGLQDLLRFEERLVDEGNLCGKE